MKKGLCVYLTSFLVIGFLVVGPAGAADAPTVLSLATKPMGGTVYSLSAGIASIFNKYADVQVRVEPIRSIKQWGPLMLRGEVDLAFDNAVDSSGAYRGEKFFKVGQNKLTSFRLLAAGHETLTFYGTTPRTGITSIKDFEGKRVAVVVPPRAPTSIAVGHYLVDDYYNLKGKFKNLEIGSPRDCVNALIEGRIDAYFLAAGPQILEVNRAVGFKPIPVPKEAVDYVGLKVPGIRSGKIPKGMYGLESDVPCLAWTAILVARESLDAELAYKLLNVFYSHLDEFHGVHPLAKKWVLSNATKNATVPFHPGAIKFYKDKGVWTPELDKIQEANLAAAK